MLEQADEVQEALGRTYGMQDVDDDELAAELDALGDELVLDNDSSYLDDVLKAPEAPSNKPEAEASKNKVKNFTLFILNSSKMLLFLFTGWYCCGRIRAAPNSQLKCFTLSQMQKLKYLYNIF